MNRFYVRKGPEGYLTDGSPKTGTTYAVLDRLACHRVVAEFDTRDRVLQHFKTDSRHHFRHIGHDDAIRLARAACRRLNYWDRKDAGTAPAVRQAA